MNFLPYPIIIKLIENWPALALVNTYTYSIYIKYIKNKKYVTVEYYFKPSNKTLLKMCKEGKYIEIFKSNLNWNYGLSSACERGHLNTINLMIEKGADDWNWGLFSACYGNHLNIVKLMIEKGASDWNLGLQGGCIGGNLDVVKIMIEMGADNWNRGLNSACREGHLNLVKLMIKKGATKCCNCNNHNF